MRYFLTVAIIIITVSLPAIACKLSWVKIGENFQLNIPFSQETTFKKKEESTQVKIEKEKIKLKDLLRIANYQSTNLSVSDEDFIEIQQKLIEAKESVLRIESLTEENQRLLDYYRVATIYIKLTYARQNFLKPRSYKADSLWNEFVNQAEIYNQKVLDLAYDSTRLERKATKNQIKIYQFKNDYDSVIFLSKLGMEKWPTKSYYRIEYFRAIINKKDYASGYKDALESLQNIPRESFPSKIILNHALNTFKSNFDFNDAENYDLQLNKIEASIQSFVNHPALNKDEIDLFLIKVPELYYELASQFKKQNYNSPFLEVFIDKAIESNQNFYNHFKNDENKQRITSLYYRNQIRILDLQEKFDEAFEYALEKHREFPNVRYLTNQLFAFAYRTNNSVLIQNIALEENEKRAIASPVLLKVLIEAHLSNKELDEAHLQLMRLREYLNLNRNTISNTKRLEMYIIERSVQYYVYSGDNKNALSVTAAALKQYLGTKDLLEFGIIAAMRDRSFILAINYAKMLDRLYPGNEASRRILEIEHRLPTPNNPMVDL